MNHKTSNISTKDIGLTAVLIMCLYLLYSWLFLMPYGTTSKLNTGTDCPKIETGKTWSIFNLLNQNWAVCSWELHAQYDSAVRLCGSTQRHSFKRAFVFKNSAWSSMVWSLKCIILLALCSLYRSADWIDMLTIPRATIPRNSVLLYCIFMPYCRIPHCQRCFLSFILIYVWLYDFVVRFLHTTELNK